jgi:hypothetical protein
MRGAAIIAVSAYDLADINVPMSMSASGGKADVPNTPHRCSASDPKTKTCARGIRKPADKRRSFRLALKGYRDLGRALEKAERRREHWQALAAIKWLPPICIRPLRRLGTGCGSSKQLHKIFQFIGCRI